ncbi:carboxylate-amine ligase [Actinophytocola gossypii]|uniref:Putative glutamate--cysteine ligase 2 n=1 Tax=Actinophytocola gossypii TaxID=2812003 RepID=A0ABT2JJH7_9PSEU|nr:glutamate--cysteine ligase [Actinophytocola gossypii]MCT2587674.1 glutamate--cysteine ligase [Actinophytocola gossypii]
MTTVGVEEEFLLADPATGRTVPAADRVLANARGLPMAARDARLHAELLATQVEAATGICHSLSELADQLVHARRQLATAAGELLVVPSGMAPLGGDVEIAPGERFAAIADRYAAVAADYQACGCHVHVCVPDQETAVAVTDHVRPWLPTLLALSANSPLCDGRDTGFASWRMMTQSRFPGSGVPPRFGSARAHATRVARLVSAGVLLDEAMTFWLVRPSPSLPTVEFRVADVSVDPEGAVLQAALSRALVHTALADLALGRPAPELDDQVAAAALWSAARYGLDGPGVHPYLAVRVPATELVADLVGTVHDALEEAGDLAMVESLLANHRTGARRQRALGDPLAVVRMLARTSRTTGEAHALSR